jgi:hypothetical protein
LRTPRVRGLAYTLYLVKLADGQLFPAARVHALHPIASLNRAVRGGLSCATGDISGALLGKVRSAAVVANDRVDRDTESM